MRAMTSPLGTFTQDTSVIVVRGVPSICAQSGHVLFNNGSQPSFEMIYSRFHDNTGKAFNEIIHKGGWATGAHKPLFKNRSI